MATTATDNKEPPALGFSFRLAQGIGRLTLEDQRLWDWLDVERLELEVPGLTPPVDLTAGAEQFQSRRTQVAHAALRIGQNELDRVLQELAPQLVAVGADRVTVHPGVDHLTLTARFRERQHLADLVATIRIVPRGGPLALAVDQALVFGFLPTPALLLAHRLLVAITGAELEPAYPGAPVVAGLGLVELEALPALLWHTFPARGWRIPDARDVHLIAARPVRGGVVARFARGADGAAPDAAGTRLLASMARHRAADRAFLGGDLDAATRAYRTALAGTGPDHDFVSARLLAIASSATEQFAFAVDLARDALSRWPDFAPAHAAVAAIRMAENDRAAAAERYRVLAATAVDEEIAVRAALVGARLLDRTAPEQATSLYERVAELRPGQIEATDALILRYRRDDRLHDLVRLLRSRIASSTNPATQASDRLALAELYLGPLADPGSAREVAQAAVDQDPASGSAEYMLARTLIASGEPERAVAALERSAAKYESLADPRGQADALLRAATLLGELGNGEGALTLYERVLAVRPEAADALVGAARSKAQTGDFAGAAALWARLVETSPEVPSKIAEYALELGRAQLAIGDLEAATATLHRASERGSPSLRAEAQRLLAADAETRGDLEAAIADLSAAIAPLSESLAQGAEPGDELRSSMARLLFDRSALLRRLQRNDEAAADQRRCFELAAPGSALETSAARALLELADTRDDLDAQRRWLDVLLAADGSAEDRARWHLQRAQLACGDPEVDRAALLADLDAVVRDASDSTLRADALELKASLLEGADDPLGRAETLAERIEFARTPFERAVASTQAARAWLEADRPDDALRLAQQAASDLDAAGGVEYSETWLTLGDAAWQKRAWSLVIQACDRLRRGTFDVTPDVIARHVHRAGIAFDETGDLDAAAEMFEEVVAMEGTSRDLRANTWRLLAGVLERLERNEEAATALESFAADSEADAPKATRADAWYRAGELYRRIPERMSEAERCLESALKLVSDHLPALDTLERLKREDEDYERVAVILGRKIAATARHPNRQKALLARLADLQHLRLGRTDVARESYARALEIDPCFRPALRFVVHDAREHADLATVADALGKLALELESDLDLPDDEAQLVEERIVAATQLAALSSETESLDLADAALAALEANLVPDDYDDRVLEGMENILRVKKDWRGVADVLGQRAANAGDRAALSWDLERIDLLSGTVNDKGAALAATRAALSRSPDDPTLLEFARTLESETLGASAEHAPGTDHIRPAELRADADRAYQAGDYAAAARHLERLVGYHPLGSDEPGTRHFGNRAARGELFLQLADLYYDHLDDPQRARESMRRAAEAFGTGSRRDATLRLLASEALAAGAPTVASDALESIEAHRLTGSDRLQLARALTALGQDHRAIEVLSQARMRGSLTDEGAKMLAHLHRERQRKTVLADALERGAHDSPPDIAEVRLREALNLFENALASVEGAERVRKLIGDLGAGEHRSVRATDLSRAADAALSDGDSAVAADLLSRSVHEHVKELGASGSGIDSQLLATLDRLRRVTYTIAPSPDLGGTGHFEALVRGLLSAATIADPELSIALLREAGTVKRNQLRDPRGAADALARAFARHPEDTALFAELAEALRAAGDHTQLIAAFELHLPHLEGARRARALTDLARIVRSFLGDGERARALLAEAASADPSQLEDDSTRAREAELELSQGRALEEEGRRDGAIAHYYAAFAKNPADDRPLLALERLYGELGDTESQANVLGQLIEHASEPSARAELWFRRARLYRDELRREHDAYRCMKEAYANDPHSADIANSLRSMAMARGEWPLAAELLYREIAGASDDRERAALQLELGMIYEQKLMDPRQAIRNYRQALELDPSIPAAPEPLARLLEREGEHGEAARRYETAASLSTDGERRVELLREALRAAERAGLGQEAHRLAALLGPGDAVVQTELDDSDTGPTERLERKLLSVADDDERLSILHQLLKLTSAEGDTRAARRHARAILDIDGGDVTAYLALKNQAEAEGDVRMLAELLEARARSSEDPDESASLSFQLGNLQRDEIGDVNAAVHAYESALLAAPDHPGALDALAQIAYLRSDWELARELFARLNSEASTLPAELIAFRRGEIAEMLGLDEEAALAFATAAGLAPGNRHALAALVRASVRIGDMAGAIEAARARLDLIGADDLASLTAARLELAQLCDATNDIVTAIYYYEMVLAEDPNNRVALEALVTLYAAHGDHQGAIRTLRSLIAIATDLQERAERHYLLGEIFRANVGDHEAAAGEYLKAVDLDPEHAPTLRRLLDYYWALDDAEALHEIATDLDRRDALVVIETPSPTLARIMLAAALAQQPLAQRIASSLPGDVSHATATVMLEALQIGRSASAAELAAAAGWLADRATAVRRSALVQHLSGPTPEQQALRAALEAL